MEEVHRLHKDVPFGWVKLFQGFMEAQAQARHERALLVRGDRQTKASVSRFPDHTYRMIRAAFAPRM